VAIDFSDMSDEVLRTAKVMAEAFDGSVVLAHVFDPMPSIPPMVWSDPVGYDQAIASEIEDAIVQTLAEKRAARLSGVEDVELVAGRHTSTWRGLVELAEQHDVDQVIVGSHGRSGVPRMLLGSVAEQVVRHAPCSVLVVRPA
jgi:universal stress protein A